MSAPETQRLPWAITHKGFPDGSVMMRGDDRRWAVVSGADLNHCDPHGPCQAADAAAFQNAIIDAAQYHVATLMSADRADTGR